MTADVNVIEKVGDAVTSPPVWEAARDALATRHDAPHIDAFLGVDPDDPEHMAAVVLVAARDAIATAALSALADPDVQAGIAEVLDEHDMDRLPSGRPYCWTHHTHDPLHLAAAVAERLTGGAR